LYIFHIYVILKKLQRLLVKGLDEIKKQLLILLGNGFTIDLLHHMGQKDKIDVVNLFNQGDRVPWLADNEAGFLSFKRCPNLWNLGARPNNHDNECASNITENIISCANTFAYSKKVTPSLSEDSIYIRAYKELCAYLKYLFIYYNDKVNDKELETLSEWGWYKLFSLIKNKGNELFESVTFITYNYDIWLERILLYMQIPFNISGITYNEDALINIVKPHGSISFQSKRLLDNSAFKINYNRDLFGGILDELNVEYSQLYVNSTINAMIPPSGESSKFSANWSQNLHKIAKEQASSLIPDDEVIMCGLSYWHVDRTEIDDILISIDNEVNFKMFNPVPPPTLNAVISSIFKNYVAYTNSDILGGFYE